MTHFAPGDGARIAYDVAGTGPDIVLIHAGVTDRHMWDEVVPLLSGDHRVTRYDLRGFGETVQDEATAWAPRRDLLAVMDAAEIEHACVVGVSMGGGAAINAALEWPNRFTHLVAVNAGLGGFDYQPDAWENEIEGRITAAYEQQRFDDCAALEIEMWLAGPHRSPTDMKPSDVERVRQWLLTSYTKSPDWGRATPMDPPAAARLGEISIPTLAILGELDVAGTAGVADEIASAVPRGGRVVMEGTAHLSPMENPDEFVGILRDFLSED